MDVLKRFEPLAMLFMVLGALNWGIIGLFDENVIYNVFGDNTFTDVVYTVIGVSALMYVRKLLEMLHIGGTAHPRSA